MGLSQEDIHHLLIKFMLENYLNDQGNSGPIVSCQLAPQSNWAIVELSSVEETNRVVKLECKIIINLDIMLFNEKCKVIRMADTTNIYL